MTVASMRTIKIFYCYARKDKALRDELEKHLEILKHLGLITPWYDREIQPGVEWKREIDRHLNTADIVLLLISADFMHSTYCYGTEMRRALERHEAGEARVLPIILRPVDWKGTPISELQALPAEGKAITKWTNRDEAFEDVARGIRKVVETLLPHKVHKQWQLLVDKGDAYYQAEDYYEALVIYEQAIGLDPMNALAYERKAKSFQLLEEHKKALHAYEQAISLDPTNAKLYRSKGNILEKTEQFVEALTAYEQAVGLDFANADLFENICFLLRWIGSRNAEEAATAYERITLLQPKYFTFYYEKGDHLKQLGRYEDALVAYNQAIRLSTDKEDTALACEEKGEILCQLKRYDEALRAYKRAIRLVPRWASLHYGMSFVLGQLGRADEAKAAYERGQGRERRTSEISLGIWG